MAKYDVLVSTKGSKSLLEFRVEDEDDPVAAAKKVANLLCDRHSSTQASKKVTLDKINCVHYPVSGFKWI